MPSSPRSSPSDRWSAARLPDTRLYAPAAALWAGCWWGTAAPPGPVHWAGWLTATVVVAGWAVRSARSGGRARSRPGLLVAAAALLAGILIGHLHALAVASGPLPTLAEQHRGATVVLTLTSDPRPYGATGAADGGEAPRGGVWLRGTVTQVRTADAIHRTRSPVLAFVASGRADEWSGLPVGSTVAVPVDVSPADPGSGLAAVLSPVGRVRPLSGPSADLRAVHRVRTGLHRALDGRPEVARALVPALVLGDTSAVGEDVTAVFRDAGMLHLLAVSGSNLTLLLAFLVGSACALGLRGRSVHVLGAVTVGVFVGLCRTEPSVLRAAAMGLVGLVGLVSGSAGGPARGLRAVAVATLGLLGLDPWLARSVGFVLSVLATVGIVALAGPWTRAMGRWLPARLAEAMSVPLAAQIVTTPVSAALSGEVSLVALFANVAAGPLVGPATVAGFLTAGLGVVAPPAAALTGRVAGWAAIGIARIAEIGAGSAGATMWWPGGPVGLAMLTVACAALVVLVGRLLAHRAASVLVVLALIAVVLRGPPSPGWPPAGWAVLACDVGQGNAVLLRAGADAAVLVDTGSAGTGVVGCLRRAGVRRLPAVALSHLHDDHAGALAEVVAEVPVGAVLTGRGTDPPDTGRRELTTGAGDVVGIGEVRWHTLAPPPGSGPPVPGEENDASMVGLAEVAGVRVLLPGDLEQAGQQALLRRGPLPAADVLVVAHHGSRSQESAFLLGSRASVALISVGADNDYGHPNGETLDALRRAGMVVVRTDERGDVAVVRRGDSLVVVGRH